MRTPPLEQIFKSLEKKMFIYIYSIQNPINGNDKYKLLTLIFDSRVYPYY